MVKRSRLQRGMSPKDRSRLRVSLAKEMHVYSDKMVKDFATSPKSVREKDPMMQLLYELAKREQARRKELKRIWGEKPLAPPPLKKELLKPIKAMGYVLDLPYRIYSGKIEGDIERATDYFFQRLETFTKKTKRAGDRWHQFAVAHHLARKTTTDFIKEGYDVVNRFKYDTDPKMLKMHFQRYKKKFPKMIVVPTQVRGKKYYDLMVKADT